MVEPSPMTEMLYLVVLGDVDYTHLMEQLQPRLTVVLDTREPLASSLGLPGVLRVKVDNFSRDVRDLLEFFDSINPEKAVVKFVTPTWVGSGLARKLRQDSKWKTLTELAEGCL